MGEIAAGACLVEGHAELAAGGGAQGGQSLGLSGGAALVEGGEGGLGLSLGLGGGEDGLVEAGGFGLAVEQGLGGRRLLLRFG